MKTRYRYDDYHYNNDSRAARSSNPFDQRSVPYQRPAEYHWLLGSLIAWVLLIWGIIRFFIWLVGDEGRTLVNVGVVG